jgi:hypothetical protein
MPKSPRGIFTSTLALLAMALLAGSQAAAGGVSQRPFGEFGVIGLHGAAITDHSRRELRFLAEQKAELELLKLVQAEPVSAYFYGEDIDLEGMPLEFGVKRLAFRFQGDDKEYSFTPEGELFHSDWHFEIFSPAATHVLLQQDHFGPLHIVSLARLKSYLLGEAGPDHVLAELDQGDPGPASVVSDARWISRTSVEYIATCCGDSRVHRWTIPSTEDAAQ